MNSLLKNIGFSDKETKIYSLLLEIGNAPISVLAYKTGFPRTTVKFACDKLLEQGIISKSKNGNKTLYKVESLDRVLSVYEKRAKEAVHQENMASKLITEIKTKLDDQNSLPKVKLYEGKNGIIKLYENILSLNSPLYSFEDSGVMGNLIQEYIPLFMRQRIQRKIWNHVICSTKNPTRSSKKEYRRLKTIEHKLFPFTCDIKICEDQMSILSFNKFKPVGITINHSDIIKNFKVLFDYVWNSLPEEK